MRMKKMIAANKACTYMVMSAVGAMMGTMAAKMVINHCCCTEKLKCKAKKAFKNMEDMF